MEVNTMKKNTLKKLLSLSAAAALALSLTACGGGGEAENTNTSSSGETGGTVYRVGICNYVDDASLNQIVENIQAQLIALGEEHGVTF